MTMKPPGGAGSPFVPPDAINVSDFGARGDGETDDTEAIQAAMNEADAGTPVYFPIGVYVVSSPLVMRPHQSLIGSNTQLWWQDGDDTPRSAAARIDNPVCVLKVADDFAGITYGAQTLKAVLLAPDDGAPVWGGQIRRLGIEGNRVGADIDGILLHGQATDWHLEDVEVANMSGAGIRAQSFEYSPGSFHQPQNMTTHRCFVHNCEGHGFDLQSAQDSTFTNSWSHQNDSCGWFMAGCRHTEVIGCKAEWNGFQGFRAQGDSEVTYIGCRTDMNEFAGFEIYNAGSDRNIMLLGVQTHRDGRNGGAGGGDNAGVYIHGDVGDLCGSVLIYGLTQTVGASEFGGGGATEHPENGVLCTNTNYVYIDGLPHGVTTAVKRSGTNTKIRYGPSTDTTTGNAASPTRTTEMFDHDGGFSTSGKTYLWNFGRIDLYATDGSGGVLFTEQTSAPGAPASNRAQLYCRDNGAGKTQLAVRFPTGAVQVLATEP